MSSTIFGCLTLVDFTGFSRVNVDVAAVVDLDDAFDFVVIFVWDGDLLVTVVVLVTEVLDGFTGDFPVSTVAGGSVNLNSVVFDRMVNLNSPLPSLCKHGTIRYSPADLKRKDLETRYS